MVYYNQLPDFFSGYWSRSLKEDEAKGYIIYWSRYEEIKLFKGDKFKSTVTKIIGKKRTDLVKRWLQGTQILYNYALIWYNIYEKIKDF
ncbi:TIGR04540 family protein [Clostridium sp. JNZ X4-2]